MEPTEVKPDNEEVKATPPASKDASEAKAAPAGFGRSLLDSLPIGDRKKLQNMEMFKQFEKKFGDLMKKHPFWDEQPVPKFKDTLTPIEKGHQIETKKLEDVKTTPTQLIEGFEWADIDLTNAEQLTEVYNFLKGNYVEDDEHKFRFDYEPEFLCWALTPPGYYKDWIIGVRVSSNKKLVGFISGIPVHVNLQEEKKAKMAEINFLCVHSKLRTNRLAPVLIKEVTRRINLRKIWRAVYTAGVTIPTPIAEARYYHRFLNVKKLVEIDFTRLSAQQTIARAVKLYKLPEELTIPGIRPMKSSDIKAIHDLLNEYLSQFDIGAWFSEEHIKHWFLGRPNVVYTYVVEKDKVVTDFFSFYSLPSQLLKDDKHKVMRAAYSFYNVAKTVSFSKLIENALVMAAKEGFDVYNALDIMENKNVFEELKFKAGDGQLNYYLYNWRLPRRLNSDKLGIVLV